jgi:hypothetical protein
VLFYSRTHIYRLTTTTHFTPEVSWGSLEIKLHEPKNRDKTRAKKKGKNEGSQKNKLEKEKRQ